MGISGSTGLKRPIGASLHDALSFDGRIVPAKNRFPLFRTMLKRMWRRADQFERPD
jgi:hypothetical protein